MTTDPRPLPQVPAPEMLEEIRQGRRLLAGARARQGEAFNPKRRALRALAKEYASSPKKMRKILKGHARAEKAAIADIRAQVVTAPPPEALEVACAFCGAGMDPALGKYGCPNCHGEGLK